KIVDYLMLGKPILGITPSVGATADVLRRAGCPVVEPEQPEEIAAALYAAINDWCSFGRAGREPDTSEVSRYEIRHIGCQFGAVINSITRRIPPASAENDADASASSPTSLRI